MIYNYFCEKCDRNQDEEHKVEGFKEYHPKCTKCGSDTQYKWVPTITNFILKDGASGSWVSKGERFKKFRASQSEKMEKRQKDRYGHLKRDAIPNYGGKETETWREAQFQAMKEKGAESAATFNDKVKEETSKKGKIII